MTTWQEFTQQAPELAEFGKARFAGRIAYLATVRADGSPRVHPVSPIIGEEIYLFMEPTSPKGKDLQRDPRYALHCSVEAVGGGAGEFYVRGRATLRPEPHIREQALRATPYTPHERYILFVLTVEFAFKNVYTENGFDTERWRAGERERG